MGLEVPVSSLKTFCCSSATILKKFACFSFRTLPGFISKGKNQNKTQKTTMRKYVEKKKKNVVVYSCLGFFLRNKSNLKGTLPCLITCC